MLRLQCTRLCCIVSNLSPEWVVAGRERRNPAANGTYRRHCRLGNHFFLHNRLRDIVGYLLSFARPPAEVRKTSEAASDSNSQMRSEEHTSELQSRLHLVCRLLLEKK